MIKIGPTQSLPILKSKFVGETHLFLRLCPPNLPKGYLSSLLRSPLIWQGSVSMGAKHLADCWPLWTLAFSVRSLSAHLFDLTQNWSPVQKYSSLPHSQGPAPSASALSRPSCVDGALVLGCPRIVMTSFCQSVETAIPRKRTLKVKQTNK